MALSESHEPLPNSLTKVATENTKRIQHLSDDQQQAYLKKIEEAKAAQEDPSTPLDLKRVIEIQEEVLASVILDLVRVAKESKRRRGRPKQRAKSGVDSIGRPKPKPEPKLEPPVMKSIPMVTAGEDEINPEDESGQNPEPNPIHRAQELRAEKASWAKSPLENSGPIQASEASEGSTASFPEGWSVEQGSFETPEGWRIIMDAKSKRIALIMTKNAIGMNLNPEELAPIKSSPTENNLEFLTREFPSLEPEQIRLIQEKLYQDTSELHRRQRLNNIAFESDRYDHQDSKINLPEGWFIASTGEIVSSQGPTGYSIELDNNGYPVKILRPGGRVMAEISVDATNTAESQFAAFVGQIEGLINRLQHKSEQSNQVKHAEFYNRQFDQIVDLRMSQLTDLASELAQAEAKSSKLLRKSETQERFEDLNEQFAKLKQKLMDDYAEKLKYDINSFLEIVNDPDSIYEDKELALKHMEQIELAAKAQMLSALVQIDTTYSQMQINALEERRFAGMPVGKWSRGFRSFWTEHPKTRLAVSTALTGISVVAATTGFIPVAGAAAGAKKVLGTYGAYVGAENTYRAVSDLRGGRRERRSNKQSEADYKVRITHDEEFRDRAMGIHNEGRAGLTAEQINDLDRLIVDHKEFAESGEFERVQEVIKSKIANDKEKISRNPKVSRRAKTVGLTVAALVGFGSVMTFLDKFGHTGGGGGQALQDQAPASGGGQVAQEAVPNPGGGTPYAAMTPEQAQAYASATPDKQAAFDRFARTYSEYTPAQRVEADAAFARMVSDPEAFQRMYNILGPNPTAEEMANFQRWVSG